MNLKKVGENTLLFTFDTRKEITLTFFRIQEYYESPNENLVNKRFSVWDFLNESMDKNGNIDYFSFWTGFNFPDKTLKDWLKHLGSKKKNGIEFFTPAEDSLIQEIKKNVDWKKPFYIIGALEIDKETIDHELAHAFYYLNKDFKMEMTELFLKFAKNHRQQYMTMKKSLLKMGYNENVIQDEVQAYLATSKKAELVNDFGLDYTELTQIIKEHRKVLSKYNTFKI